MLIIFDPLSHPPAVSLKRRGIGLQQEGEIVVGGMSGR